MTLALDSLEQCHLLKNTSSALACKKKMHVGEFFSSRQPYFRTARSPVGATETLVKVAISFQAASRARSRELFRVFRLVLNSRII
jgi:hypothetical protein